MKKLERRIFRNYIFLSLLLFATIQTTFAKQNTERSRTSSDEVKGLYISGWNAGNADKLNHFIELANKTEINAYVIDVKEDDGLVSYSSGVKEVKSLQNWTPKFDPSIVLSKLHKNKIRVIGRIVCFKDPMLPEKRPDLALKDKNGNIWRDRDSVAWLDPYNKATWQYLVDIAKEAVKLGFDEIQFDYVRFTTNGDVSRIDYGDTKLSKYEVINGFLSYARQQLPKAIISADVFGIICESPRDTEGIGQYLELIGKDIDYISPMIYPSLYAQGQIVNGVEFPKPDLDPYGVVFNAISKTKVRIANAKNFRAKIRPYLQDYTDASLGEGNYQQYGAKQIREQIDAVYKTGYRGWLFWNYNNDYSEKGFLPKKRISTVKK